MPREVLRRGMDFVFGSIVYQHPRLDPLTTNTTVSDEGYIIPVDSSGGTVTVTLASSIVADGAHVVINDEGGAAATNGITIATEGSETIDGATSQTIGSDYGALSLYSDGVNWFTRSSTGGGGTL